MRKHTKEKRKRKNDKMGKQKRDEGFEG